MKWTEYRITNTFDKSVIYISWDGIKLKDAENEVLQLVKQLDKNMSEFIIEKM